MMPKNQIVWFWLTISLIFIAILSTGCGASAYEFKGTYLDPPLTAPNITLTANTGQPFRLNDDVQGDVALIFFGYTFCPDVCPLTLADIRLALEGLNPPDRERVQVIFITADPDRDTPETLTRYLNAFDPAFIGLTGQLETIQAVMEPLGAFGEKEEATATEAGYFVSHTARLYVLTPDGQVPLMYAFGFEPEDLREDLIHLLAQSD